MYAKFEAILKEPLTIGYNSAKHCGVLTVVRYTESGDVEYIPIAEIGLISSGPREVA